MPRKMIIASGRLEPATAFRRIGGPQWDTELRYTDATRMGTDQKVGHSNWLRFSVFIRANPRAISVAQLRGPLLLAEMPCLFREPFSTMAYLTERHAGEVP